MGRRNKTQTAVEDFEVQFGNLVQEYLGDIDVNKIAEYFRSDDLCMAVWDILNPDEDTFGEDEND